MRDGKKNVNWHNLKMLNDVLYGRYCNLNELIIYNKYNIIYNSIDTPDRYYIIPYILLLIITTCGNYQ